MSISASVCRCQEYPIWGTTRETDSVPCARTAESGEAYEVKNEESRQVGCVRFMEFAGFGLMSIELVFLVAGVPHISGSYLWRDFVSAVRILGINAKKEDWRSLWGLLVDYEQGLNHTVLA